MNWSFMNDLEIETHDLMQMARLTARHLDKSFVVADGIATTTAWEFEALSFAVGDLSGRSHRLAEQVEAIEKAEADDSKREADKLAAIEALIRNHEIAWLALNDYQPTGDDDPIFEGYHLVEQQALKQLLARPATLPRASNRKAQYLILSVGPGGRWEPSNENIPALLGSMLMPSEREEAAHG